MEIITRESADTTYLDGLREQLKEVNKKIDNIMTAIEQGIFTSTTKERLEGFESEKFYLSDLIAKEESKKPFLTKEHIVYWLLSFKNGDIHDKDYQRRIIDTLVNAVYIYDDGPKGRGIVLTFNISGYSTATISCSDIERSAPPKGSNPNTVFFVKDCFGFVLNIKEVG
jgi:hypothetical protein